MGRNPFDELLDEQEDSIPEEPVEAIPEVLKHKPSQAKRNRDWERKQRDRGVVATYRGIPSGLHETIKRVAKTLSVSVGDVARAFLEHGLAAYEAGDLELEPQFKITRAGTNFTLFPSKD
jgi:hypothetical protein